MKIVTVNVPRSYLDAIEKLVGDKGLYPSRSELIRVAVRKFLLKELKLAKEMKEQKEKPQKPQKDPEKYVQVPVEVDDNGGNGKDPVREFKTYKIVRKLEF